MDNKTKLKILSVIVLQIVLPIVSVMLINSFTVVSNAAVYVVDSYEINTEQDLWDFASEVNNGNTFEGVNIYLNKDIKLSCSNDKQWIPIGHYEQTEEEQKALLIQVDSFFHTQSLPVQILVSPLIPFPSWQYLFALL